MSPAQLSAPPHRARHTAPARPPGWLRAGLFAHGLLVETGVRGVYGRSPAYESIVAGIGRLVTETYAPLAPVGIHLPPVVSRATFARTSYLESFPDLAGSVHVFRGGDREHRELVRRVAAGGDWPALLEPSEVVLASSACHALYPMCAGRLPAAGRRYEVQGSCFRHEPSDDPTRLMAFRMHEVVYLGGPEAAVAHRDRALATGVALLERLGLEIDVVPANDPFFGRMGKVLARQQRDEDLKLEAVTPIAGERRVAVLSGNCHGDHFAAAFGIEQADGRTAHSSCIGFGVDRVAIALLARHGLEASDWPPGLLDLLSARRW